MCFSTLAFTVSQCPPILGVVFSVRVAGVCFDKLLQLIFEMDDLRLEIEQVLDIECFESTQYCQLIISCHKSSNFGVALVALHLRSFGYYVFVNKAAASMISGGEPRPPKSQEQKEEWYHAPLYLLDKSQLRLAAPRRLHATIRHARSTGAPGRQAHEAESGIPRGSQGSLGHTACFETAYLRAACYGLRLRRQYTLSSLTPAVV